MDGKYCSKRVNEPLKVIEAQQIDTEKLGHFAIKQTTMQQSYQSIFVVGAHCSADDMLKVYVDH